MSGGVGGGGGKQSVDCYPLLCFSIITTMFIPVLLPIYQKKTFCIDINNQSQEQKEESQK